MNQKDLEAAQVAAFEKNQKDYWDAHVQFGCDPKLRDSWFHGVGFDCGITYARANPDPEVERLKAENLRLREALEYYTIKSNYNIVDEGRNYTPELIVYELDENTYCDKEIGTKARQALEGKD